MVDETREVVPNEDTIRTLIKDKQCSPKEYSHLVCKDSV
jgi:hypothetical protein